MPSLIERVREALRPEYEVERLLGEGGMGLVFLAHEAALDRKVAIKIIRPELVTAHAAERFLQEARILANLSHPNVVPVHRAGETAGFSYYVMDFLEGETLADRLRHGPLAQREALKVGRDLLAALEAVHALGVVHRDVKPSNIFLQEGRVLLSDFGIARSSASPVRSTPDAAGMVGTPGYMPPEQMFGWEVSSQSDLYAAAMVLFEAYTGRRWESRLPDERADWSGVPRLIVPVLKRALSWNPPDRWPDATVFRRRLWRTRARRYQTLAGAFGAAALLTGLSFGWITRPRPELVDVAIAPFAVSGGIEPSHALNITDLARMNLDRFVSVRGAREVERWWNERGRADTVDRWSVRAVRARFLVTGSVAVEGRDTLVTVNLVDRDGRETFAGRERVSGTVQEVGYLVGLMIARQVDPARESEYRGSPALAGLSHPALNAYLEGLRRFGRGEFITATRLLDEARTLAPGFGLATWWFANAWRWTATGEPAPGVDFAELLAEQETEFPELERLLIEAQLVPSLERRLELYEEAVARYPRHAYARFLFAAESQDRGPFVGVTLETVAERLERAVAGDSNFGPALGHLVWTYIRLGREAEATDSYERYVRASHPGELDLDQPALLGLAIGERFHPETARESRARLLTRPELAEDLMRAFRLAPMFGLPMTQIELARVMDSTLALERTARADLHEAQALGLIAVGQIRPSLAHFDSAVHLSERITADLEAAEWRVFFAALNLPGMPDEEVEAGRARLKALYRDPRVGHRAAWMLGLDAAVRGDSAAAKRWRLALEGSSPDTVGARLGLVLRAASRAEEGEAVHAERISRALLPYDSLARFGDPFARAALHMLRASWLETEGRLEAADSSLRWHEHSEWGGGYPSGDAQAAEIDWALQAYALRRRADLAMRTGMRATACTLLRRLAAIVQRAGGGAIPELGTEPSRLIEGHCNR
ncbi:MAG: protein kinase [Gemmatimonadales bacterium]